MQAAYESNVPNDRDRDTLLIQRAQAGDANAAGELYQLHAPAVFRYIYFRVADRETAEDLTGEVFLKMVESLPRYVDRGLPLAAWLFRIAHDRVVDHHRRNSYRQVEPLSEQLEDGGPDTETAALRSRDEHHLRAILNELTDEQRLAVQLRFIEGYSLDETARLMNKSTGAIKALQHRALRQLAQKLES